MTRKSLLLLAVTFASFLPQPALAAIPLGTAANFAVLAGAMVTNTGPSIIGGGSLGVSPGAALIGFPPGILLAPGAVLLADPIALLAQTDLVTAFVEAAGMPVTQDLTGIDLGGLTLVPGVYRFSSSAQLTGALTLNAQGDPNAEWVFQVGTALTTASNASVIFINQGATPSCNVFWQVGSSATLGTTTAFIGHILALTSITLLDAVTVNHGSLLARNGTVTLQNSTIAGCGFSPVPTRTTTWGIVKQIYR